MDIEGESGELGLWGRCCCGVLELKVARDGVEGLEPACCAGGGCWGLRLGIFAVGGGLIPVLWNCCCCPPCLDGPAFLFVPCFSPDCDRGVLPPYLFSNSCVVSYLVAFFSCTIF